jgi:HEAT repeat protein
LNRPSSMLTRCFLPASAWRPSRLCQVLVLVSAIVAGILLVIEWPTLRSAWRAQRAARAIRSALRHEDPVLIRMTLDGISSDQAIPALASALNDSSVGARWHATHELGRIGWRAEEVVPALIVALKDRDFRVRAAAAEALGKMGPVALPAVPELLKALKDENNAVRVCAGVALKQIDPDAAAKGEVK